MSKKTLRAALEQALLHGAAMSAALCTDVLMNAADDLQTSLREVEYGSEVDQVRLVPLPAGRVVLITGDDVRFFDPTP